MMKIIGKFLTWKKKLKLKWFESNLCSNLIMLKKYVDEWDNLE
jgi:hypothetical protein